MSARLRRLLPPVIVGVAGVATLLALGEWQLRRLAWKEALIAELAARLAAEPVAIPERPDPAEDSFLRVRVAGQLGEGAAYRLTTQRPWGPGFQVIVPVATEDGRRVLADLGYVPEASKERALMPAGTPVTLTGALFWPEGAADATPPDLERNIWFARDPERMARALDTEPLLVVAERHSLGERPRAQALGINLPNNHLNYAITWFSLGAVWAVMSLLWARRETMS